MRHFRTRIRQLPNRCEKSERTLSFREKPFRSFSPNPTLPSRQSLLPRDLRRLLPKRRRRGKSQHLQHGAPSLTHCEPIIPLKVTHAPLPTPFPTVGTDYFSLTPVLPTDYTRSFQFFHPRLRSVCGVASRFSTPQTSLICSRERTTGSHTGERV